MLKHSAGYLQLEGEGLLRWLYDQDWKSYILLPHG